MNDQAPNPSQVSSESAERPVLGTGPAFAEPGVVRISTINWGGLQALYMKEVRRFFKVQLQTIWAPAITTMLYLVIFTVALGRSGAPCWMCHSLIFWRPA